MDSLQTYTLMTDASGSLCLVDVEQMQYTRTRGFNDDGQRAVYDVLTFLWIQTQGQWIDISAKDTDHN